MLFVLFIKVPWGLESTFIQCNMASDATAIVQSTVYGVFFSYMSNVYNTSGFGCQVIKSVCLIAE